MGKLLLSCLGAVHFQCETDLHARVLHVGVSLASFPARASLYRWLHCDIWVSSSVGDHDSIRSKVYSKRILRKYHLCADMPQRRCQCHHLLGSSAACQGDWG